MNRLTFRCLLVSIAELVESMPVFTDTLVPMSFVSSPWIEALCVQSAEPHLLDWIAGLVVPVMLGLATLGVAIWAGRLAMQSNSLLKQQHEQANEAERRRRRALFAHELSLMSGRAVASRMAGLDPTRELVEDSDALRQVARAAAEVDEPTSRHLIQWVSQYSRTSPLAQGDVEGFIAITERLMRVTDLWVASPAEAIAEIEADTDFVVERD